MARPPDLRVVRYPGQANLQLPPDGRQSREAGMVVESAGRPRSAGERPQCAQELFHAVLPRRESVRPAAVAIGFLIDRSRLSVQPVGGVMATSDYPSKLVLVGYFIQKQEAETVDERDEFSQELFDRYDAHILAACAAAQPPLVDPSPEARALMALMAEHAEGSTSKRRAQNAVEAYLIHRGW